MMYPACKMTLVACALAALNAIGLGSAAAEPPEFPDLNGLADVTQDYMGSTPRDAQGFRFAVADGYTCGGNVNSVSCLGTLQGLQDFPFGPMEGACEVGEAKAFATGSSISRDHRNCQSTQGVKVLNPGQKVSHGSVTCGLLPGDITACTTGAHGFVLQPSGSWTF